MLALGMVGGKSIDLVEKGEAQSELISLQSLIRKCSVLAFTSGTIVTLEFLNKEVTAIIGTEIHSKSQFDHLSFAAQNIGFDRSGIPNRFEVMFDFRDVKKVLNLQVLLDNRKSAVKMQRSADEG